MRDILSVRVVSFLLLLGATARPPAQGPTTLTVDGEKSSVSVRVDKGGLFSFAGHAHEVVAPIAEGHVTLDPTAVDRSAVDLQWAAASLRVNPAGEPPSDVAEVQETMLGARVLDARRYPTIRFRSTRVARLSGRGDLLTIKVDGDLALHGVTRPVAATIETSYVDGRLTAHGQLSIKQTDFGIQPVSAAGGTVRVKDELTIAFTVSAHR